MGFDNEKDHKERPDRSYEFKPRPGTRPEGGWKIICDICGTVLRTKEDDSLYLCQYIARSWGWKGDKKDKTKWRCPEHKKTKVKV